MLSFTPRNFFPRLGLLATGIACALLAPLAASAQTYLVDTGAGSTSFAGAQSLFAAGSTTCSPQPGCAQDFQFLAMQFKLAEASSLDSIQAWMGAFGTGGGITVKIRENVNNLPGLNNPPLFSPNSIYSKTYTLPNRFTAGWVSFPAYTAVLAAGTYWISFEPVAGSQFSYSMPPGVPNPLPKYAFFAFGNPGFVDLGSGTALGLRIAGSTFPGIAFGSATRTKLQGSIVQYSFDYEFVRTGTRDFAPITVDGDALTSSYIFVIPAGYVHARGKLTENGLSAGAYSIHSHCLVPTCNIGSSGGGRGVAYRTYRNMSDVAKTVKINAVLDGSFGGSGFSSSSVAKCGVYALDPAGFSSAIINSGVGAAEYLLRNTGGNDLAPLFPGSVLAHEFVTATPSPNPISIPITLAPITIAAGGSFTMMFDVYVDASNASLNFANTLAPAAVLFTDLANNPVVEMVGVGPSAPASPTAIALALSPASTSSAVGGTHTVEATLTAAGGAPVSDVDVAFSVTSGPQAGLGVTVRSNADGKATFTWYGESSGTDVIRATSGALVSSNVQHEWTSLVGVPTPPAGAVALAIQVLANPVVGSALPVRFSTPSGAPATLDVYDMAGRRVATRRIDGLGAGTHAVELRPEQAIRPGVYLVRITQGAASAHTRAIVVR